MFNSKYKYHLCFISSLGISITSYFLYNYFFNTKKIIKEKEKKKDEPYENKYYDKYEALSSIDLDEEYVKSLKNNIIIETTPKGNIIMCYDFEKESFIYYSDTKDINYLYLETVSRKYAITYNCKKIVVDIKQELEDAKKEKPIKEEKESNKPNDKLFASFKNYNRKGTGGSKNIKNKFTLRQNANRYTYKGKIDSYNILQTDKYRVEKKSNFSFYEFLAMQKIGKAIT